MDLPTLGERIAQQRKALKLTQTALANRIAHSIHRLEPETVAAMHALLDTTARQPKPRLRRAAGSER